jgi:tRNA (guanine37-N1)-methyltransferase
MRFDAISVIPSVFESYVDASILGRAKARGIFEFHAHDLRTWTHDHHRTVDDAPFGGGQGMLMKPEPIFEAVEAVSAMAEQKPHVIFFSPCGKPFSQRDAERLSNCDRILFVCGRYEGMDERVYTLADEVISLGDYVLTGGELAAMTVTDAVVRLLPGALGDAQSPVDESFAGSLLEYEQYTRPATYRDMDVPEILLSGDHGAIDRWRRENAIKRTALMRPDLLEGADLTPREEAIARDAIDGHEHGEEGC